MNETNIPWVPWPERGIKGYSWNPITGCTKISEGCKNCYAAALFKRFKWHDFGTPTFHPDRLDAPLKLKEPSRIFVNSMGDLFHDDVPFSWIDRLLKTIDHCHNRRHTFFVLTKRPARAIKYLEQAWGTKYPENNLWLGVSISSAKQMNKLKIIRPLGYKTFVSIEPLVGNVCNEKVIVESVLSQHKMSFDQFISPNDIMSLNWVIAGPETGPGARPCDPQWIQDIADQCEKAKVPFFDKRDPSDKNHIRREWV